MSVPRVAAIHWNADSLTRVYARRVVDRVSQMQYIDIIHPGVRRQMITCFACFTCNRSIRESAFSSVSLRLQHVRLHRVFVLAEAC